MTKMKRLAEMSICVYRSKRNCFWTRNSPLDAVQAPESTVIDERAEIQTVNQNLSFHLGTKYSIKLRKQKYCKIKIKIKLSWDIIIGEQAKRARHYQCGNTIENWGCVLAAFTQLFQLLRQ